ncbi:MAG: type II secretion system protein [Armatimonadota bacterium]
MRPIRRNQGFTLIELITVMAISTILLGIIVVPMFESFQATRTAQAFADAQDKARLLTERLTREISESVGVKDVEGVGGRVSIVLQTPARGVLENGTVISPTGSSWVTVGMNYAKLDIVLPAKVGNRGVGGGFIDPNTGKEDPTLRAPKGQVQLPLAPGTTIRRYWVGLRDPFTNYLNPYDGILTARSGGRDNLYVLYMAEVEPVVSVAGVPTVNAAFFDVDPTDGTGRTPNYNDPDFFLATGASTGAPVNNDAKATRVRNWLNRAQIVTELSRYDMIQPVIDKTSRLVKLNDNGGTYSPRITPLIQFRPSHVEGDSSDAAMTMPLGTETEGAANLGSETYIGKYGAWSSLTVRSYPGTYAPPQPYQIARTDAGLLKIFYFDPASGVPDTTTGSGTELFSVAAYADFSKRKYTLNDPLARYPFTLSTTAAASTNPAAQVFKPFSVNQEKGRINASFAISDHGDIAQNPNAAGNIFDPNDVNPNNLPQIAAMEPGWVPPVNPANPSFLTPTTDPAVAGTFDVAPYFDSAMNRFNINRVFNKVWQDAKEGRNGIPAQFGEVGGAHRFIDLRLVPQGDRTPSPLALYPNASIVPSSEEVWGPDQAPGANASFEVRYRRVNKDPGPNEYRINYTNVPEPSAAGYAALGLPVPPASYTASSFVSAIFQPRFKAGYLQLCSNPEVPIPGQMRIRGATAGTSFVVPGRIRVAYRFQFTNATDTVRVDYDTRQLMQILVTIRNYPQSNVPNPQTVTMKATANVKNFIR